MSTKRKPDEWCALTGARILDPDGWRHDNKPWSEPITYADFRNRWQQCTVDGRAEPPVEEPQPQTEDRAADALREKVRAAIFDPESFLPRGAVRAEGLTTERELLSQWQARAILAALDLPALLAAERAKALREVADKWQWGAWGDAPRCTDRVQERIANAQFVTDWLRGQAKAAASTGEGDR